MECLATLSSSRHPNLTLNSTSLRWIGTVPLGFVFDVTL
jgi:hypothetical protein